MNVNMWKRRTSVAVIAALAATSLFAISGCNDSDVATGLGVAAIGAGAAAIIIGNNNRNDNDYGRNNRTVCSTYYDYYGNPYRDCRQVYSPYNRENAVTEAGILDSDRTSALTPEDFAKEFHLSFESSARLVSAFRLAKTGSNAGLVAMGLTTDDLNEMAKFNLPSSAGIDRMSKNINTNVSTTTGMLNRMRAWAMAEQTKKCNEARYSDDPTSQEFVANYCN